jgi:hypothetical protein
MHPGREWVSRHHMVHIHQIAPRQVEQAAPPIDTRRAPSPPASANPHGVQRDTQCQNQNADPGGGFGFHRRA